MDSQPNPNDVEYTPITGCESDDSRSSTEECDAIPGIIYTSDDSADIGQSDSTYADSDGANYIAQYTNVNIGDEISRQLLLDSEQTSPQPSPQIGPYVVHPLSPHHFAEGVAARENIEMDQPLNCLKERLHLSVPTKPKNEIVRSTSSSTISTERSDTESNTETQGFLAEYQRLTSYPDDPLSLNYNKIYEDPIKSQAIQAQLNFLTCEDKGQEQDENHRWFVGNVHIDAKYKDAFYVRWNWYRIRQSFAFLHVAFLVVLLCVGIGLLIQMPRGTECDPYREWWQGSVSYEIFVPSFQDSDGDGIGDIRGIVERLDYLENLGIRSVQLSALFDPDFMVDPDMMTFNYRSISPVIGHQHDVQLLAALLHERNMFLLIEIPVVSKGSKPSMTMNLIEEVPEVLSNWTQAGVDGFVFEGLERIADNADLPRALNIWRNTISNSKRNFKKRVMVTSLDLFKRMKELEVNVESLLPLVDLIYVHFDVTQSAHEVATSIKESTKWDDHVSYPWLIWKTGGIGQPRLADQIPESGLMKTLGSIILQLFLPGSVSIFYGDEIGLPGTKNHAKEWATIMQWSDMPNGGFSSEKPWLSLSEDWETRNVMSLNDSLSSVRDMVKASQNEVPIYVNGIFDYEGDYHPKKSVNYKIRNSENDLLILDRFYPRRNKFAVVINLAHTNKTWDLSKLYFCGQVIASSHMKEGDVDFKNIILNPGEALAFILD